MFCPKCAEEVSVTAVVCPYCKQFLGGKPEDAPKEKEIVKSASAPITAAQQPAETPVVKTAATSERKATETPAVKQKNGLAIVAFILTFVLPGFVPFIMGIVALKRSKKRAGKGKGLSIAAIILSILGGIASVVATVVVAIVAVGFMTTMPL